MELRSILARTVFFGLWAILAAGQSSATEAIIGRLEQRAESARLRNDPAAESAAYHDLGVAWMESGNADQAVGVLRKAASIRRGSALEGETLLRLAGALRQVGSGTDAYPIAARAAAHFRAFRNRLGEAKALYMMAVLIDNGSVPSEGPAGRHRKVLGMLARSRALFAESGDRHGEAVALAHAAMVQETSGQWHAAMKSLAVAETTFRQLGDRAELARSLYNRALAHSNWLRYAPAAGNPASAAEARRNYSAALALYREVGPPDRSAATLMALGRLERETGNLAEARAYLAEAIALMEKRRASITDDTLRRSYFAAKSNYYRHYVRTLMDSHEREPARGFGLQALEASELRRARMLMERLGSDPTERPFPIGAFQELLDEHTALIEYSKGDGERFPHVRDPIWAWVITRSSVRAVRLAHYETIASAARELEAAQYRLERSPRQTEGLRQAAAALGRLILDPLFPLPGIRRIVFVPDSPIRRVSFEMLPAPGAAAPLGLRMELIMAPSARVLAALRELPRPEPPMDLAIFADPVFDHNDPRFIPMSESRPGLTRGTALHRLPFSLREAESIASQVEPRLRHVLTGFEANRSAVLNGSLDRYRMIHFATHASASSNGTAVPEILLSTVNREGRGINGRLRLDEIAGLRLPADLVVISACRSGIGREELGEGVLDLGSAFLATGARTVLTSRWEVDDQATAEFMRLFYSALLGPERLAPTAALLRARKTMAATQQWSSPAYWAGFFLQGDWVWR